MNKRVSLLLSFLLLLGFAACGKNDAPAQEATAPVQAAEVTAAAAPTALRQVRLVHARANDYEIMELSEDNHFLARAVLPDKNTAVDHWEINGQRVDSGNRKYSLEFDSKDVYLVEAVLRVKKSLVCDGAYFQFLNESGKPDGAKYLSVSFEDDYTVPLTGALHAGGKVTVHISAVVPVGKAVDYWLINDVPFCFEENVQGFTVVGLNAYTKFQAVLKDAGGTGTPPVDLILRFDPPQETPVDRPEDDVPLGGVGVEPEDLTTPSFQEYTEPVLDAVPLEPETEAMQPPPQEQAWEPVYTPPTETEAPPVVTVEPPVQEPSQADQPTQEPPPTAEPTQGNASAAAHEHTWVLNKSDSFQPTCGEEGQDVYICSGCGEQRIDYIPATGQHSWMEIQNLDDPTAMTSYWICMVCGATSDDYPY